MAEQRIQPLARDAMAYVLAGGRDGDDARAHKAAKKERKRNRHKSKRRGDGGDDGDAGDGGGGAGAGAGGSGAGAGGARGVADADAAAAERQQRRDARHAKRAHKERAAAERSSAWGCAQPLAVDNGSPAASGKPSSARRPPRGAQAAGASPV